MRRSRRSGEGKRPAKAGHEECHSNSPPHSLVSPDRLFDSGSGKLRSRSAGLPVRPGEPMKTWLRSLALVLVLFAPAVGAQRLSTAAPDSVGLSTERLDRLHRGMQ